MAATPHSPLFIPGEALDFYLGQGYYRMHQDLFTCHFLPIENELYTAHWLRLVLSRVQYGPQQRRLLRLNERFTTTIQSFRLTEEYETLYALYRNSITFDAPPTIEAFLLAGATHNVFTTEVIEIRDGGQLIALGIFDSGVRSMAGIMNFYHPEYRKYSLGKYLMLLKLNVAQQRQYHYYYPGYMVHQYPKFDYKLFPCPAATQVYDSQSGRWRAFSWAEVARQSDELLRAMPEEEPDSHSDE
ncbi:GNAT family N-acetyltransferase [Hymenobacter sp. BT730]|uniref:GNAT family N-acetyltransferase n=1 Tax=Hymenobacter sp. BT730 TaxID=3063332 RepID=UPI0026E0366A|nr:GNAT family N-acetyltransferase [Hymenobacter sp. BT730]